MKIDHYEGELDEESVVEGEGTDLLLSTRFSRVTGLALPVMADPAAPFAGVT